MNPKSLAKRPLAANPRVRTLLLGCILALAVPRPAAAQVPVYDHGVPSFSPLAPCDALNPYRFLACPPGYGFPRLLGVNWYTTTDPAVVEVLVECIGINEPYVGLTETHVDRWTYSVTGPLLSSPTPSPTAVDFGQSATLTLQLTCTVGTQPSPQFTGIVIPIQNSTPLALAAPGAVTVAPGANSVSFLVTGKLVDAPTPVTLSITLFGQTISALVQVLAPTPEQLIATTQSNVTALVNGGSLSSGQGNALKSRLQEALDKLNAGQTNVALNLLRAFVNQVRDLIRTGVLTPAEGQPLIEAAESLIRRLGG